MENIWTCDSILHILNTMWRLMKHILEKKVLFYGVIVRTFWMTLVITKIRLLLFMLFLSCVMLHARLFIDVLFVTCWEWLTSWLLFVMPNCEFVTFPLISWVRCGAWLYRFLIFALFHTFSIVHAAISKNDYMRSLEYYRSQWHFIYFIEVCSLI